jgi:chorismate synthase
MGQNTLGKLFKITSFGESHGEVVGIVIDGLPAGLLIDGDLIQKQLDRRKPGRSEISTTRKEQDKVQILSGVFNNLTTGAPLCMIIKNKDIKSEDYEAIRKTPRPGHADLTSYLKYDGLNDYRGGGRFSGRITAGFVMAGAVAKKILENKKIDVKAYTIQIDGIKAKIPETSKIEGMRDKNIVYCPDALAAEKMIEKINEVKNKNDSVGGIIQCTIYGVPPGIGEPIFSSIESEISKAIFSIPGVKAIEFGSGFKSAELLGSQNNDNIIIKKGEITTETNNAGGILGGLSIGTPILFNVAIKPTSSIGKEQKTINLSELKEVKFKIHGRHDPCIVPRAVPVIESLASIVIVDLLLQAGKIENIIYDDTRNVNYQRKVIDRITIKMLDLLKSRIKAAKIIGEIKNLRGKAVKDSRREQELLNKCINYAKKIGLPLELAERFIKNLINESIKIQAELNTQDN